MTLAQKLHPNRFTNMSTKFAAVLGYLLDEEWTDPVIEDLAIDSQGFVIAYSPGARHEHVLIGTVEDLERNLERLADAAGLTQEERVALWARYSAKVTDWRKEAKQAWGFMSTTKP